MTARQEQNARHRSAVATYYAHGNADVLGPVLVELRTSLLGFIRHNLKIQDTSRAEDLAQETLADVLKELRAHKYDAHGMLTTYVFSVCKHLLYSALRTKKNGITTPGADEDPFQFLPASVATPAEVLPIKAEDEARAGAVVEAATRAVLGLDANARAVVVLHYYHGYSVEDAARQLGIEARKAQERLRRGVESLRRWGSQHAHLAPTADEYAALPRLNSGDLFQEHGLRLAS